MCHTTNDKVVFITPGFYLHICYHTRGHTFFFSLSMSMFCTVKAVYTGFSICSVKMFYRRRPCCIKVHKGGGCANTNLHVTHTLIDGREPPHNCWSGNWRKCGVQCLAQGHSDMWTGGGEDQTSNPAISG